MPIDFQKVFEEIRKIGAGARERQQALAERRALALKWLEQFDGQADGLRKKVERAALADPALRCALPVAESLTFRRPAPGSTPDATLIAADGSQIAPDRHAPEQYALINVGAVVLRAASAEAPSISTESQLFFDQEVANWTDGMVALKRDLAERLRLLALAADAPAPVITLTDGPLQLWEARESAEVIADYQDALQKYLSVLSQLHSLGAVTAGYVDKPASELLPRLLEVATADESELEQIRARRPLIGVTDRWLFGRVLAPGERSAVFALQSKSRAVYAGALELHFFYLNVGRPGHEYVARVEVPAWVARDPRALDDLHALLVAQCRILGAKPYPYILHRAHETALVTREEKEQIDQRLQIELRRQGAETDEKSSKQAVKDGGGRTRYRT